MNTLIVVGVFLALCMIAGLVAAGICFYRDDD